MNGENPNKFSDYDVAVFATQGGGAAIWNGTEYVFIEEPDCPGLKKGDMVPDQWDIQPINEKARQFLDGDQQEFNRGVDELFNHLFEMADQGQFPRSTIGDFFPDSIKETV